MGVDFHGHRLQHPVPAAHPENADGLQQACRTQRQALDALHDRIGKARWQSPAAAAGLQTQFPDVLDVEWQQQLIVGVRLARRRARLPADDRVRLMQCHPAQLDLNGVRRDHRIATRGASGYQQHREIRMQMRQYRQDLRGQTVAQVQVVDHEQCALGTRPAEQFA